MFDGGPIWEATLADLPGLSAAHIRRARVVERLDGRGTQACCLRRHDRADGVLLAAPALLGADTVELTAQCARLLEATSGDELRAVAWP